MWEQVSINNALKIRILQFVQLFTIQTLLDFFTPNLGVNKSLYHPPSLVNMRLCL